MKRLTYKNEYEVKEILDKRYFRRRLFYRVQWKGYPKSKATWEPVSHLKNAKMLINDYERQQAIKEKKTQGRLTLIRTNGNCRQTKGVRRSIIQRRRIPNGKRSQNLEEHLKDEEKQKDGNSASDSLGFLSKLILFVKQKIEATEKKEEKAGKSKDNIIDVFIVSFGK